MKRISLRSAWTVLVLCLLLAGTGQAATHLYRTDQVEVSLLSSHPAVSPGQRLTVGFHQKLAPGWHSYWRNPGETGAPTQLAWQLPPGSTAGPVQWPAPSRFLIGPVVNHGYTGEVTLLTEVTVPQQLPDRETWTLGVHARWLVCQEQCIPQQTELTLSLPIQTRADTSAPPHAILTARQQLPQPLASPVSLQNVRDDKLRLALPANAGMTLREGVQAWFYPHDPGLVDPAAAQPLRVMDGQQYLELTHGDAPAQPGQMISGTVVIRSAVDAGTPQRAWDVQALWPAAAQTATTPGAAPQPNPATGESPPSLVLALLLAFLGGLTLNLMPCVFPVLSIKALSLLSQGQQAQRHNRLHGLTYTAGVLSSFAVLAGLLITLKAGGAQLGWGFQFQSPAFVLLTAFVLLALGLNLSGVFSIGASAGNVGHSLASRAGHAGSFFTGVLATVVATPCTAPFMGAAVGFALTQHWPTVMAVFLSLGLGLALPFLLLSWWPALQRCLPQPGLWMLRFKQALAFPLYLAAAWLVWVLGQQAGTQAMGGALVGGVVIAFSAWVYDSSRTASDRWRQAGSLLTWLCVTAAVLLNLQALRASEVHATSRETPGAALPYSPEKLATLRAQGQPVFLNLTAAWCITCLANERLVLSDKEVEEAFRRTGVTYLKGDWTNQDPAITDLLADFERSGVPLYVYYPPGSSSQPQVLPQLLTLDTVISRLPDVAQVSTLTSNQTASVHE